MYPSSVYGAGSGVIAATTVQCNGNEKNLTECILLLSQFFASHFFDVGVKCFNETGTNEIVMHFFYCVCFFFGQVGIVIVCKEAQG